MQWGTAMELSPNGHTCYFPIVFNSIFNITIGKYTTTTYGTTPVTVNLGTITTTNFNWGSYGGTTGYGMFYIALGS